MVFLVSFMALVMAITYPTTLPTDPVTESPDQCQLVAASGDEKPFTPFKQPINPYSLQVTYGLAPHLDIPVSEDEGSEPDKKKSGGGHQLQPNNHPLHHLT